MERYDFRAQRLFVEATLNAGTSINPERGQANYLLNVLRMKEDSPILVFNGTDGEWLGRIKLQGRKACSILLEKQIREQTAPAELVWLFAPLKQARLDYMVQKAVEMGAGILQPVLTHHTQVTRLNPERMKANAIEAAEQCGILSIPVCAAPVKLEKMLNEWDETLPLIFCDESAAGTNPLATLGKMDSSRLAVLIGPEGGFSSAERDLLHSKPFVTAISLGPRILRADTAAVAALAVVQASCGDWQE